MTYRIGHTFQGQRVTVLKGVHIGRSGNIVHIHDASVRRRRYDVLLTGERRVLCFAANEIGIGRGKLAVHGR